MPPIGFKSKFGRGSQKSTNLAFDRRDLGEKQSRRIFWAKWRFTIELRRNPIFSAFRHEIAGHCNDTAKSGSSGARDDEIRPPLDHRHHLSRSYSTTKVEAHDFRCAMPDDHGVNTEFSPLGNQ
ncbi:hypothetical protein [Burkholderia multivorans]|nr:hypothetical protein [Burkholderia multivorans]